MIIVNGIRRDGGHGKRPVDYDFANIAGGSFQETIGNQEQISYQVQKDGSDRITAIESAGLPTVTITWEIPPWVPPYLYLANGARVKVLECTYDSSRSAFTAIGDTECSLFYPDTGSPGTDLSYTFANGCRMEYISGSDFSLYDKNGTFMPPAQTMSDLPNTYALALFYAYVEGNLCMGLWYATRSYCEVDSRARNGIPGSGYFYRDHTRSGVTDPLIQQYKYIASRLTAR